VFSETEVWTCIIGGVHRQLTTREESIFIASVNICVIAKLAAACNEGHGHLLT